MARAGEGDEEGTGREPGADRGGGVGVSFFFLLLAARTDDRATPPTPV